MTLEDNKETARRFILALAHGNVEDVRALMVPNPFFSGAVERLAQGIKRAIPDSTVEITDEVAEGDTVVIAINQVGLNSGPMMGNPPTGKELIIGAIFILKLNEGRVISMVSQSDLFFQMHMAAQS